MSMFRDIKFWEDALERAVKTAAQVAVAFLAVGQTALGDVDWQYVASVAAVAAIASVLTSVASYNVGTKGSASLVEK